MSLSLAECAAVFAAGAGAGTLNSVAGAGSLVTFPTLVALGYGSVTANVSNTVGLAPGGFSGAYGYRREIRSQRPALFALLPWAVLGAVLGSVLLLVLPGGVFDDVVPILVLFAAALVLAQPRLAALRSARREARAGSARAGTARAGPGGVGLAVFATGVYGGYFGAAQGVLLIGILGIGLPVTLQQANGLKNGLAATVNLVAAAYFVAATHVAWEPAVLIAVGSALGGAVGSRYGRRVPARVLRPFIGVLGAGVALTLLLT